MLFSVIYTATYIYSYFTFLSSRNVITMSVLIAQRMLGYCPEYLGRVVAELGLSGALNYRTYIYPR